MIRFAEYFKYAKSQLSGMHAMQPNASLFYILPSFSLLSIYIHTTYFMIIPNEMFFTFHLKTTIQAMVFQRCAGE